MMTIFNHKPLEFEDSRNKNTLQLEYVEIKYTQSRQVHYTENRRS